MANTKENKATKPESHKIKQKSSQSLQSTSGRESAQTGLSNRRQSTLGTSSPFSFMRRFTEEMDRLFEDFGFGRGWLAPTFESNLDRLSAMGDAMWAPRVEVIERDNQLIVRADLPGMTKDDVNVDIVDDALVIRGERANEREENDEGYYRSERSYGTFYRRIPLPVGAKTEDATADFRNGVLEINMPTSQAGEQKRRQIDIRGETEGKQHPQTKAKAAGQK
jgi:HSP20 family protein